MTARDWLREEFGALIRIKRLELNYTEEFVAGKSGLDPKHIGKIERGEKLPNMHTAIRLLFVLDLTITHLTEEFGEKYFDEDDIFKE